MEVNEEKRQKFIEYAGKRVNNVMHDIQILEPMSRSSSYDYTRQDLEEMFTAMEECLSQTKASNNSGTSNVYAADNFDNGTSYSDNNAAGDINNTNNIAE